LPLLSTLHNLFFDERERWFAWLPVLLGAGIIGYFVLPFEPAMGWLGLVPLLLALLIATRRWPQAQLIGAALLALAIGFTAAQLESRLTGTIMLNKETGPIGIKGRLMLAEPMPDGARLTLDHVTLGHFRSEITPQQIRLKVKQDSASLPPAGSWLEFYGEVGPPSTPVAPGGFDFRRQAYFQGLGAIGWTYGDISPAEPPSDYALSLWDNLKLTMEQARRALAARVAAQAAGETAAMTEALLTGSQSGIDKDVMQAMRASGLAHLLSISGIHVSMVGILIYWPLRALLALVPWLALRFPIKKWAAAAAIFGTMGYTLLVGVQTPTLRSALMTGILMLAIMLDRKVLSMRLVALSALTVMLVFPSSILGPSFQMSFAAVLAMVALYEKPLDAALRQGDGLTLPAWFSFVKKHATSIIITSLVATAATTPFSLYHFQSFSFYGVIANMIAIPLTSFWIMPCLMLTYVTAPFGGEAWFIQGAALGSEWIIAIARHVAAWPYAILHWPAMPVAAFVAIVSGGLWLCLWRRRWRYLGLLPILCGMLYPFYTRVPDLVVDPEGKQWAIKITPDRYAVADLDKEKFTLQQWQQRLSFPELIAADDLQSDVVRCDTQGCVARLGESMIALPRTPLALAEDCVQASLIIAPFLLRHCPAQHHIDAEDFRQRGAHSVTHDPDGSLQVDYAVRHFGRRPWSPMGIHRPQD
jgi:competence protein ComEC